MRFRDGAKNVMQTHCCTRGRLMNLLRISPYINTLCLNNPDTVARLLYDFDKR